ncbi:sortase [Streptomyces sp. NBC_01023]|uniref:sortase domain-containing protein n=1 Tax=unclassified Streptomyces TaxID=2593676 RepID=UPI0030E0BE46|nr:sortase [Streptomyces sp. NBC_01023]
MVRGPTPGKKGAAATAGHMDTPDTGEAVLCNVRNLKKDQGVKVHREDGTTADFAVDSVDTFQRDKFPTGRVYKNNGKSELHLITCGGEFTKDRRTPTSSSSPTSRERPGHRRRALLRRDLCQLWRSSPARSALGPGYLAQAGSSRALMRR